MFKKSKIAFFLLVFGFLFLPFSVWADTDTLTYRTTINNWKPNNKLYIEYPPAGWYTTSWKLICDGVDIPLTVESGFAFENVSNTCTSAVFEESITFEGDSDFLELGVHEDYVEGSSVNFLFSYPLTDTLFSPTNIKTYMSQSYNSSASFQSIVYTFLNEVDSGGNIIGPPYVSDVYFNINGEKETTVSLGSITLPNFDIQFDFSVRGNIASQAGTFDLTFDQNFLNKTIQFSPAVDNGYVFTEEPLDIYDLYQFYSDPGEVLDFDYICVGEESCTTWPDYDMQIENLVDPTDTTIPYHCTPDPEVPTSCPAANFGNSLFWEGNTAYLSYSIIAELSTDGSDTGLFYNLMPFIIMILFGGAFLFFFVKGKKKKKEASIVDQEIL